MDRKGRTIDLVQCLIQPSSVLLIVSPSSRKTLYSRLDQHIFFGDKVVCLAACLFWALNASVNPVCIHVCLSDAWVCAWLEQGPTTAMLFTRFHIANAASKLSVSQVEVADISDETVQLRLAGPQCDSFIASLGAGELVGQPHGSHAVFKAGMPQGLHNVSVSPSSMCSCCALHARAGSTVNLSSH